MKKQPIIMGLVLLSIVGIALAQTTPQKFSLKDAKLAWDHSTNAVDYIVSTTIPGGAVRQTTTTNNIVAITTLAGTNNPPVGVYSFSVVARNAYGVSPATPFSADLGDPPLAVGNARIVNIIINVQ